MRDHQPDRTPPARWSREAVLPRLAIWSIVVLAFVAAGDATSLIGPGPAGEVIGLAAAAVIVAFAALGARRRRMEAAFLATITRGEAMALAIVLVGWGVLFGGYTAGRIAGIGGVAGVAVVGAVAGVALALAQRRWAKTRRPGR